MLHRRSGKVLSIASDSPRRNGVQELIVEIEGVNARAINYIDLTGPASIGDQLLLNTTAVGLKLGTGGVHFVISNLTNPTEECVHAPGHIMKLRYTPAQNSVLSIEEDASPDKSAIHAFESLYGMPVICCELHSQIAPAAAAVKASSNYEQRIAYIMTDGAALPVGFSRMVAELREKALLDVTITCGQAFGGEIEAVNLYTALIAAKQVANADISIICQGPGNTGTGSEYGFSGIEQGECINTVNILGGIPVVVLRMSFADARERHQGISHHTLTILNKIAITPAHIPVPILPGEKARIVVDQLQTVAQKGLHKTRMVDGETGLSELARRDVRIKTMGRSVDEDREFFLAASAGGVMASELRQ